MFKHIYCSILGSFIITLNSCQQNRSFNNIEKVFFKDVSDGIIILNILNADIRDSKNSIFVIPSITSENDNVDSQMKLDVSIVYNGKRKFLFRISKKLNQYVVRGHFDNIYNFISFDYDPRGNLYISLPDTLKNDSMIVEKDKVSDVFFDQLKDQEIINLKIQNMDQNDDSQKPFIYINSNSGIRKIILVRNPPFSYDAIDKIIVK